LVQGVLWFLRFSCHRQQNAASTQKQGYGRKDQGFHFVFRQEVSKCVQQEKHRHPPQYAIDKRFLPDESDLTGLSQGDEQEKGIQGKRYDLKTDDLRRFMELPSPNEPRIDDSGND
jgi:hypothetical protein